MEQVSTSNKSEHWREVVSNFESSGLSQSEFSRQQGLAKNRLSYWINKFRECKPKSSFVELDPKAKAKSKVELEFPSGVILRVQG